MTFSEFLKIIYKNRNSSITLQSDFLRGLVNSTGGSFIYEDDYFKRIFNGSRPLTEDFRKNMPERCEFLPVFNYIKSCIDPNRLDDLLRAFEIPDDEKKDLDSLIEALVIEFGYYMEYGEEFTTTVAILYYDILDAHGNGQIENADEKALCAALNYYAQAINAVASIRQNEDLISLERPFENCFDSIYKAFKVFNDKCTHRGKECLKYFKEKILNGSLPAVDSYLSKIATPGANPIELQKEIKFIVYDNYKFEDKTIETVIKIDDKSEKNKILEEFRNLKFYPVNEIFFTEFISFRESDKEENLLEKIYLIFDRLKQIFENIRVNLDTEYIDFKKKDEIIKKAFNDLSVAKIQYYIDGIYFPKENKLEFAPTIEFEMGFDKLASVKVHDTTLRMDENYLFKDIKDLSFQDQVRAIAAFRAFMWEKINFSDELFCELYLLNPNGTFRLFAVPITCKSRIYRLIREACLYSHLDKSIGIIFSLVTVVHMYTNPEELEKIVNMYSDERMQYGVDELVTFGYKDNNIYTYGNTIEEIKGKMPPRNIKFHFNFLAPLIGSIIHNTQENKKSDSTQ